MVGSSQCISPPLHGGKQGEDNCAGVGVSENESTSLSSVCTACHLIAAFVRMRLQLNRNISASEAEQPGTWLWLVREA